MINANENTVSSKNQLPVSSSIYYLGCEDAPKRLLIVGNSITRHAPSAKLGWFGDWGMAASAKENDFVHVLEKMLEEAGINVLIKVHQLATWERGHTAPDALEVLSEDREFNADALLFRLGENVNDGTDFRQHLSEFVDYICPNGKAVFTTTVWAKEGITDAIASVAEERGEPLVELYDIGRNEKYMAIGQYEHKGVAMHPSDAGMKFIAESVLPYLINILKD